MKILNIITVFSFFTSVLPSSQAFAVDVFSFGEDVKDSGRSGFILEKINADEDLLYTSQRFLEKYGNLKSSQPSDKITTYGDYFLAEDLNNSLYEKYAKYGYLQDNDNISSKVISKDSTLGKENKSALDVLTDKSMSSLRDVKLEDGNKANFNFNNIIVKGKDSSLDLDILVDRDNEPNLDILAEKDSNINLKNGTNEEIFKKISQSAVGKRHASGLPLLQEALGIPPEVLPLPFGLSVVYQGYTEDTKINGIEVTGKILEKPISPGAISLDPAQSKTRVVNRFYGLRFDVDILPFLGMEVMGGYLENDVTTTIRGAKVNIDKLSIPLPLDKLPKNITKGYLIGGGPSLKFAYKGFFGMVNVLGFYVNLDEVSQNIDNFVSKPVLVVAPRIGYNYKGFTAFVGIYSVKLFGDTKGKMPDLGLSPDMSQIIKLDGFNVMLAQAPISYNVGATYDFGKHFRLTAEYQFGESKTGFNFIVGARF